MTAILTTREQVVLALFVLGFGGIGLLYLIDWVSEQVDDYLSREKVWREIDVRCSRERHPSYQASLYDWENES